jgi:hypothetical protein
MKKQSAKDIKRAKTFRQIRAGMARAKLWKERWAKHPETMRANLDKINAGKKAKAEERTQRLTRFAKTLPEKMQSGEMRQRIGDALEVFGRPRREVEMVVSALRRRAMLTFDLATLTWTVAYPRLDDNVQAE